jgi:N-acetylglutamate synthase-like GNAT family acetyltransferase
MGHKLHTGYLIRPFAAADAEAVVNLVLSIQQQEFGVSITADEQPDLLDVTAYYQRNQGNFWVAGDEGRIVGTIGLLDVGGAHGVLRKMFVATSHRGTGVAAELLQTCLTWARTAKMTDVMLGTTERMKAAHRFYEKWGFVEVAAASLPSYFPRMRVDTKFYRYRFEPPTLGDFGA